MYDFFLHIHIYEWELGKAGQSTRQGKQQVTLLEKGASALAQEMQVQQADHSLLGPIYTVYDQFLVGCNEDFLGALRGISKLQTPKH